MVSEQETKFRHELKFRKSALITAYKLCHIIWNTSLFSNICPSVALYSFNLKKQDNSQVSIREGGTSFKINMAQRQTHSVFSAISEELLGGSF